MQTANWFKYLTVFSLGALSLTASIAEAETSQSKPNVVLFFVDDLGWSDTASYGSSFYETPNIDALANDGVRFTDAYATSHVCSPSRASLITGKYPARIGLTDWLPGRPNREFQKLLKQSKHVQNKRNEKHST